MSFWCTGFDGSDETSANPNTHRPVNQRGCKATAIVDPAGGNYMNRSAVQWALVALDGVNACGNK